MGVVGVMGSVGGGLRAEDGGLGRTRLRWATVQCGATGGL